MTKRSPRPPRSPYSAKPRPRRAKPSHLAMPRRSRARRAPSVATVRAQHESQCTICIHPHRAAIDNDFMHWHAIGQIAYEHKVSRSAIYRHAYAMRLFARRNHELRFSLGHLIERVQDVEPTAGTIVRAVKLFARINDDGELMEPPARVIVSSGGARREVAASSSHRPITISLDSPVSATVAAIPPQPPLKGPDASVKGGTLNRPHDHANR